MSTWLSVFYLITTDILGPQNAPWAIAQVGYAGGVLLYVGFALAAYWTGMLLRRQYLALDSDKFPVKTFADLVDRIFGRRAAQVTNGLQTLQLLFIVAIISLTSGQALSLMVNRNRTELCFTICILAWALAGMIVSQIRSLAGIARMSRAAVFLNIAVLIITMIGVAKYAPNYASVLASYGIDKAPIVQSAFNSGSTFRLRVNGATQAVFAFGGSMLFIEFMAEMRRPSDFWKALVCSQVLILLLYLFYGLFCYAFQGQFVFNPANQGISKYWVLTVSNAVSIVANVISSSLYANIGIKLIYQWLVLDVMHGPPLMTHKGRIVWSSLVVFYWSAAYLIAACIPNVSALSGIVASACILQFSYTLPPLMSLGLAMQTDAMRKDQFDPTTMVHKQCDTWKDKTRWRRALMGDKSTKMIYLVFFLAACGVTGMGLWASFVAVLDAFKVSAATAIGCQPPV